MKRCRDSRCSLRGNPGCRGTFGVLTKCVRYRFSLQGGTGDFPCDAVEGKGLFLRRRWNHVFFLELRRDCRVTTGNSGFLFNWPREVQFSFELRVRTGDCSRDTAGPNRAHLGLCPGPNVPLLGRQLSRHCILDSPGESGLVSRGSQGHCSPVKLRRVYLGAHCVA